MSDALFRPLPPIRHARIRRALERIDAEHPRGESSDPSAPHGVDAVPLLYTGASLLTFRGRRYVVRPVPFARGLELVGFAARLERLAHDGARQGGPRNPLDTAALRELATALVGCVALFRRLVRPVPLLARLAFPWRANPFADVTAAEFCALLRIFDAGRRRSDGVIVAPAPMTGTGRAAPWN